MLKITLIIPLILFVSQFANAAIVIDILTDDGSVMKVMSNGKMARMNNPSDSAYVLVDYKKQTMQVVMPEEKQVLNMSGDLPVMGGGKATKVSIKLSPQGSGPKIAGYATKKYKLLANGKGCGTVYGSMDAMKATGIDQMFAAMQKMTEQQSASMGSFASMMDDCDRADMALGEQAKNIGIPMRSNDKTGKLTSEVKRIDTSAKLPAGTFAIPKGYKVVSMADKMQQAQQSMQQMQNSGQMPPEAMEQMKRMQEMMQQQPQQ